MKTKVEKINENQFEEFASSELAVIDFFADWCMPCVMMGPIFEQLAEHFKGKIKFAKVNVDENSNLASRYDVMSIPTFLVFRDGEEIYRHTGSVSFEQFKQKLNSFLE